MDEKQPFQAHGVRLLGNKEVALTHVPEARQLLQKVRGIAELCGVPVFKLSRKLDDGSTIEAGVFGPGVEIVRIFSPTVSSSARQEEQEIEEAFAEGLFLGVPVNTTNRAGYTPDAPLFSARWKNYRYSTPPQKLSPTRVITDASAARQHPGHITWFSKNIKRGQRPLVLSWYGGTSRYSRFSYFGRDRQLCLDDTTHINLYGPRQDITNSTYYRLYWYYSYKPAVWVEGVKFPTYKQATEEAPQIDVPVISAALKRLPDLTYELWVVTYDVDNVNESQISVMKGPIDIKNKEGEPVKLTHVFNIDFRVRVNGPTPVDDVEKLQWEPLLQPPYFNGSCTKIAGLVAVSKNSTVNPSASLTPYSPVVLMTVDIATQTTTFPLSDLKYNRHATKTYFGNLWEPFVLNAYYSLNHSGGVTDSEERRTQRYAGVDFDEDEMLVAVMEFKTKISLSVTQNRVDVRTYDEEAYSAPGPDVMDDGVLKPSTLSWDASSTTKSLDFAGNGEWTTGYKLFVVGEENTPIAEANYVSLDSVSLQASLVIPEHAVPNSISQFVDGEYYGSYFDDGSLIPDPPNPPGESSGAVTQSFTNPRLFAASLEGGDLRHRAALVWEYGWVPRDGSISRVLSIGSLNEAPSVPVPRCLRLYNPTPEIEYRGGTGSGTMSIAGRAVAYSRGTVVLVGPSAAGVLAGPNTAPNVPNVVEPMGSIAVVEKTLKGFTTTPYSAGPSPRPDDTEEITEVVVGDSLYPGYLFLDTTYYPYHAQFALSSDGKFGYAGLGTFRRTGTHTVADMTSRNFFLKIAPEGFTVAERTSLLPGTAVAVASPVFLNTRPIKTVGGSTK